MQEAAQFETADPTRLQTTDLQAGDTMRGKPLLVACAVLGTMLPEMLFAQAAATSDSAAAAAALTVTPDYASDGWVDSNQPIGLRFSRPLNLQTEHRTFPVMVLRVGTLSTIDPDEAVVVNQNRSFTITGTAPAWV
ncbi:MAG TPA: hypothetical protein VJB15_11265 [Rhodothermia bacterium]|nr:hypothetical protein [Rhodothermia bacterium]